MRLAGLLGILSVLAIGCSFPVDEFRSAEPTIGDDAGTRDDAAEPRETGTVGSGVVGPAKCDDAPAPHRYLPSRDACYFLAPGKHRGSAIAAACSMIPGAHPVTIAKDEHAIVMGIAQEASVDAWIGLVSDNGGFVWVTGEDDPYRAWRDGFPKKEDALCVFMKKDGGWENRKCGDELPVLCER